MLNPFFYETFFDERMFATARSSNQTSPNPSKSAFLSVDNLPPSPMTVIKLDTCLMFLTNAGLQTKSTVDWLSSKSTFLSLILSILKSAMLVKPILVKLNSLEPVSLASSYLASFCMKVFICFSFLYALSTWRLLASWCHDQIHLGHAHPSYLLSC